MSDNPVPAKLSYIRPVLFIDARTISRYSFFLRHLLAALNEQGCHSLIVTQPGFKRPATLSSYTEIVTYPLCRIPLFYKENRRHLREHLLRFAPNLLHCASESKARLTQEMAAMLKVPYILGLYSLEKPRREAILNEYCASIMVPSPRVRTMIEKQYPQAKDKISLVRVGAVVNKDIACFSDPDRVASIVVMHPFEKASQFAPLITAIKQLRADGLIFMVAFVGTGPAQGQVRKMIRDASLTDIINIADEIGPLRNILLGSDIFVQPAPTRLYNGAMLEAMSVGVAVASCRGGIDDLLVENETAAILNPYNPESIRSVLKSLLTDRNRARALARGGQEFLRQNHPLSAMTSAIIETFKLAASRTKPLNLS